jgi:hypothetical protein
MLSPQFLLPGSKKNIIYCLFYFVIFSSTCNSYNVDIPLGFERTTVELFDQSSKFDKYLEKKYKGYLDVQYLTELRKLKYILIPVMIS